MSELKTLPNDNDVKTFIAELENETKKQDSLLLLELYIAATSEQPKMWGEAIIGFGIYHYKSEKSSQEGDWPLAAFSPRKQNLTLYLTPGFDQYQDLLITLGKYKTSKSCLYINKLQDVDLAMLKKLIHVSYIDAKKTLT